MKALGEAMGANEMRRLVLSALLLTSCAATPRERGEAAARQEIVQRRLARELAGLTPGKPTDCLPPTGPQSADSQGYGGTIVFRVSDRLKYRNDAGPGCEAYGSRDVILVTQTSYGRLCRGDIARLVDRNTGFTTGSCPLGDFVPYRRP